MSSNSSIDLVVYQQVADVALLRPIHDDEHYEQALAAIRDVICQLDPSNEEVAYMDALTMFVERYEAETYTWKHEDSPQDLLQFLLEEHGMTGSDLGRLLGNRSLGGAILRGERHLSKSHIKLLADHFSVSPSLFF